MTVKWCLSTVCIYLSLEAKSMGRIFKAVQPHMPEFCEDVDPVKLITHLRMGKVDDVGLHLLITVLLMLHCFVM